MSMEVFKRKKRELVEKGHIFDYCHDYLVTPEQKEVVFDTIVHKGAAAVVPVTAEGNILMVRQYRNALERVTLEIPAGGLDGAEEPTRNAAARELEEETGYASDSLEYLMTICPCVAYSTEKIDIYVAKELRPSHQNLDEDEFIDVAVCSVQELTELILKGEIQDAKTVAAILAYREKYC